MAATDKTYRSQHTLDVVFAISSLLMLASIIWMFADDYFRPFKTEQRAFREVESGLAQRLALSQLPTKEEFEAKKAAFESKLAEYATHKDELADLKREVARKKPEKESADAAFNAIKADQSSFASFYDIAMERGDGDAARNYAKELEQIQARLSTAQAKADKVNAEIKEKQARIDAIEKPLTDAQSAWKQVTDKFDAQIKIAYTKQWGWGDWFRTLPILDAFASPIRIQQITNNDIPIDYNFKMVTRFDRCTTCHLGIDRPVYTKEALRALKEDATDEQNGRLEVARALLKERIKAFGELPRGAPGQSDASRLPQPGQLTFATVNPHKLTEGRVNEFAVHPRLELFVGANSKHPMERFGCSACHSGQGSATDFTLAAHTPNTAPQKDAWVKQHDWEAQHMWDFPMLPQRFVESSCLKCHHEVTDLVSSNNREEAPKLLRGYNLIKENGCFGCHEIAGIKAGREIGPDLRLEPYPPLEDLTALERTKMEQDAENPPGHMRKVGPSLFRIKEKTNLDWVIKWIRAPREFRPDTKMPHFYGLSNNSKEVLAKEAPEQQDFPDAEINAVAHYLFKASGQYLNDIAAQHSADKQKPQAQKDDEDRLDALVARGKDKLNAEEQKEFTAIRHRIKMRREKELTDLAPDHKGDPAEGRRLFTERGCLACHSHEGTIKTQGSAGGNDFVPGVHSVAQFGPNLSQAVAKLGQTPGDKKSARTWLIQWIMDPHVHSPRSRMPVTHLTANQAADVAAWLLAQTPTDLGPDWDQLAVPEPGIDKYKDLARVYLVRLLPKSDIEKLLEKQEMNQELFNDLPADEKEFVTNYKADQAEGLKHYVGRKAIGRLGCYACHDVPGFEAFRPIGTGLNDWGKKDPGRLAFENIDNFVEHHFYPVQTWSEGGKIPGPKVTNEHGHEVKQMPYEAFFFNDLLHHGRTGYLHQKVLDPRSYDYGKKLAWDDRSRMPQFRFARAQRKEGEGDPDFAARAWKDEADAREAVMTFILGLVADPIPERMRNRPSGDRLAEVKGRQVIDKYNCAGCHMIRPGSFEFNVTPDVLKELERAHGAAEMQTNTGRMYTFPMHYFWTGKSPTMPDRLIAPGANPRIPSAEELDPPDSPPVLQLVLAEALRFIDSNKAPVDLPTYTNIYIPLKDFSPAFKDVKSPDQVTLDQVKQVLESQLQLGGRFSDLMVPYLVKKDSSVYKPDQITKDSPQARASLPPSLIGEGERTQPQWLYQFLLDPTVVRRMTILRMPKFNMSRHEAKLLVDYFAGVDRISNPGIGLTFPGEIIPQQAPLNDPFWVAKNSEYVARLKSSGQFDARLKDYADAWKEASKLANTALQVNIDRVKQQQTEFDKQLKAKKDALAKAQGDKKAALEKDITDLEVNVKSAAEQLKAFETAAKEASPEAFQRAWVQDQAYVSDAYRMIVNKAMCLQCHEVGGFKSTNPLTQGPPLALANERLRPDWMLRWISTPQRHLTYESLMPVNFPRGKVDFQHVLVGQPPEQLEAIRDAIMNYPRVSSLPVNQQWNPNLQPGAAAAAPEKK
jgi:mono/diheme cytochrome c family protein